MISRHQKCLISKTTTTPPIRYLHDQSAQLQAYRAHAQMEWLNENDANGAWNINLSGTSRTEPAINFINAINFIPANSWLQRLVSIQTVMCSGIAPGWTCRLERVAHNAQTRTETDQIQSGPSGENHNNSKENRWPVPQTGSSTWIQFSQAGIAVTIVLERAQRARRTVEQHKLKLYPKSL